MAGTARAISAAPATPASIRMFTVKTSNRFRLLEPLNPER
jgi:hypothetical protein